MEDSGTLMTIKSECQGIYKDKGSKFLSFGYSVTNEEEIKQILNRVRKKYHDARHCCFAFRIGIEEQYYRVNDDGEPSGTAGKPIFGQIESNNLTNILLVVVRYFGGKLLGTSGLINAYRSAAADCLSNTTFSECKPEVIFDVSFPYEEMNSVMRIVKDESLSIIEQHSDLDCRMKLSTEKKSYDSVSQRLSKLKSLKIKTVQG